MDAHKQPASNQINQRTKDATFVTQLLCVELYLEVISGPFMTYSKYLIVQYVR